MRMKQKALVLSVLIGVLFIVGALVFAPAQAQKTEQILKIGVIQPMTGSGAAWGIGAVNGQQIAVDEINEAGGINVKGVRYKLELVVEDDKYSGEAGLAAANKLITRDKVFCLSGLLASAVVKAVQGLTEPMKYMTLTNGYSPEILKSGASYSWRPSLCPQEIAPVAFAWFQKQYPKVTKMLHLTKNDATGWGSADAEIKLWTRMGLQVIGKEFYEPGTKDFTPIVTKVIGQKPELVAMAGTAPGDSALILKLFHEMGFKPYLIHTGGYGTLSDTVKICGKEAMEGALTINIDYSSPRAEESVKRFYQKYTTKFKGAWNDIGIWDGEYDQMFVLKAALEKAQSFDHTALKRVMEDPSFRYKSIYGEGRFGGVSVYGINHQGIVPVFISMIKGGEASLVAKESLPSDY